MCAMSSVAAIDIKIALYRCITVRVLPYLNISSLIGYELTLHLYYIILPITSVISIAT